VKPCSFDFARPASLDEALACLARDPASTKVLAGGQSLMPLMNLRLARPARLVDINRLPGFDGVRTEGDEVRIASCTRHLSLQETTVPGPLGVLLRRAAKHIGHLPIRTRGTFGGSIAHGDAASEWCLVATMLDAKITVRSQARGPRDIPANEFFLGMFTTAMEPDELLIEVSLPALDDRWVTGIAEFSRRAGDFAIVAVAGAVALSDGRITDARVALGGVSDHPIRSIDAESLLIGETWEPDVVEAAANAAAYEIRPSNDSQGDAAFRRDLVRALLPRSLGQSIPVR
jgi:carbon-monoxide dehydrogenase medium subunit